MQNRAYSVLSIKAIDEEKRIIRGVATTPEVDRVGDIVDPLGLKFENPMPFLWQHQHDKPIGTVKFDKPTKDGINFEAELPTIAEEGTLRDRIEEAWQSIKAGLVRAVSIGFRPIEYSYMDSGGIRFNEAECFELSAVTIPANSGALITAVKAMGGDAYMSAIKALDREARHEAGVPDPDTIPAQPKDEAAIGKSVRVVKLDAPARDRAPFQIRSIKRI